jgi:hypothetical protein
LEYNYLKEKTGEINMSIEQTLTTAKQALCAIMLIIISFFGIGIPEISSEASVSSEKNISFSTSFAQDESAKESIIIKNTVNIFFIRTPSFAFHP